MAGSNQIFYANGKLLLTGEYFVLHNAKAVALPVKFGQKMEVFPDKKNQIISWEAFSGDVPWFVCTFQLPGLEITETSNTKISITLQKILETIRQMNPDSPFGEGLKIRTTLNFNSDWGLGSSSTLIANLSNWAAVNPFKLNEHIFNGSGYDIACADAPGPIIYQKNNPQQPVNLNLNYPFAKNLYFIYSGSKKNTRDEIRHFLNNKKTIHQHIEEINTLSEIISKVDKLAEFQKLVAEHEKIISATIKKPTIKSAHFNDFSGEIKSLGAWGGDFFLAASSMNEKETKDYFRQKGLQTIFSWKELILNYQK